MKRAWMGVLAAWMAVASMAAAAEEDRFDAVGNFNPIVPGYFADPTIRRFGDTYYLYATTDGNGGGRGPSQAWVSKDFVNWVLVPMNWPTTPFYWAPDVVKGKDGRYYLYYNQPCMTHGAVSDSPVGPWTPLLEGDSVVVRDQLIKGVITLDSQVFEDRDGKRYMYWGTWGIFPNSGCGIGRLNDDMKSFSGFTMIPNTQAKDFFEAPFMIERNGVYYFTYSSGSCHDDSYRVQYAVGDKPDGKFVMGPNNPILASNKDRTVHGPGHHSILEEGNDYYMIYHRHDIPYTPNGMHRQVCADRMVFEKDGEIRRIEPTHRGIGALTAITGPRNLARGAKVTASSHYSDTLRKHEYRPEYAVDDNNATLWRPADNRSGQWLVVDLGSVQRIRRTAAQFEYATWAYQYLIECSTDGKAWKTFVDRRSNTRWGSPMVDRGDAEARYVRITVTGTEFPGLFGSLWNFKVYDDAAADPLEAMADKAFDAYVANKPRTVAGPSVSRGLLVDLDAAELPLGTSVGSWKNKGAAGGEFAAGDTRPLVDMAAGRKAVRFTGQQFMRASFPAPASLAGNSSFTVAAWVMNPQVADAETIVSWGGRGGPDGATGQLGYGTQGQWGAVGHWGFADMGYAGGPPKAGEWHHIAVAFDGVVERLYVDGKPNSAEAKMLLVHPGRPIFIGAAEPGTEHLDGYLASLRMYDTALGADEIAKLAAAAPVADVLVHADAARLDFGELKAWRNDGLSGGSIAAGEKAPAVKAIEGRIAAQFAAGESMSVPVAGDAAQYTVLISALVGEVGTPMATIVREGGETTIAAPAGQGWRQVAVVCDGQNLRRFVDGKPEGGTTPAAGAIRSLRLGGGSFAGAVARVQVFKRALSEKELGELSASWKAQLRPPTAASFEQKPAAISPKAVTMAAKAPAADVGPVEYLFSRGAEMSSGWISANTWLDYGLKADAKYAYTVRVRDALGNVSAESPVSEVATDSGQFDAYADDFATAHDYLADGVGGTMWEGLLSKDMHSAQAAAAKGGVLRLASADTAWDGRRPTGPLLYRTVKGDFVVEVKIADYAGLKDRRVPGNNDGGLMVRVPAIADAGEGEDLVQLSFFPIYDQGNMWTSLDGGGRPQRGNRLAWDAHRWLQIERRGEQFFLRTSPDGKQWQDMPGSPIARRDMAGLPVQVGLCHAAYGKDVSYIEFAEFRLWVRKGQ